MGSYTLQWIQITLDHIDECDLDDLLELQRKMEEEDWDDEQSKLIVERYVEIETLSALTRYRFHRLMADRTCLEMLKFHNDRATTMKWKLEKIILQVKRDMSLYQYYLKQMYQALDNKQFYPFKVVKV